MLNEVAPPGWGHTKAEKEKTKPDKPKSMERNTLCERWGFATSASTNFH